MEQRAFKLFTEMSKDYESMGLIVGPQDVLHREDVQLGTLLRIARYLEAMSLKDIGHFEEVERDKKWNVEDRKSLRKSEEKARELRRQNQALREKIKKLKQQSLELKKGDK